MKNLLVLIFFFAISSIYSQEGTPELIRGKSSYEFIVETVDATTGAIVEGIQVYLYETATAELIETQTSIPGGVSFFLDPMKEYEVRTCHPAYLKNGLSLFECNEGDEILCATGGNGYAFVDGGGHDKPIAILKATLPVTPFAFGSVLELKNVYYDLDRATLRREGKRELDKLYEIMKRNESITIELSSHTDARGSDTYNEKLSQRRAQSCFRYLVGRGIAKDRIIPKGYGETRLRNHCADGTACSEEEHQINRRTEIEVLTYEEIACDPYEDKEFVDLDLDYDPNDR